MYCHLAMCSGSYSVVFWDFLRIELQLFVIELLFYLNWYRSISALRINLDVVYCYITCPGIVLFATSKIENEYFFGTPRRSLTQKWIFSRIQVLNIIMVIKDLVPQGNNVSQDPGNWYLGPECNYGHLAPEYPGPIHNNSHSGPRS